MESSGDLWLWIGYYGFGFGDVRASVHLGFDSAALFNFLGHMT